MLVGSGSCGEVDICFPLFTHAISVIKYGLKLFDVLYSTGLAAVY